jgi:2-(1,2-epoxy-1,2-dihydrophenyl)acetyl-CoA isomerase
MTEPIRLKKEGGIVEVLLNRPEAFNAFDLDMIELLEKCLISLAMDDSVSVLVISGEGRAFCAGGDLRWALNFPGGPAAAFHELAARYHQAILEILRMRKPVIAAVNGIAAGGGFSLALACDFRVMAQSAKLRQGYTSNGLCIDGGGTLQPLLQSDVPQYSAVGVFKNGVARTGFGGGSSAAVPSDGSPMNVLLVQPDGIDDIP